jgi:hypothetical protein
MTDDASDFHVRTGRIRDRSVRAGRRQQSFVNQVLKAAARAKGAALTPADFSGGRRRGPGAIKQ